METESSGTISIFKKTSDNVVTDWKTIAIRKGKNSDITDMLVTEYLIRLDDVPWDKVNIFINENGETSTFTFSHMQVSIYALDIAMMMRQLH